ncbi:MAG TPA: hypothetical protein PLG15_03470 [Candidatus Gastranaerophilaceae bacterium]|nr:hypothetical protein [Candidatus Gastranaerophilaceae bacterium]HPT41423.1 hypothetical protein [Candidatus Gastranaerophilaceae bacterium]
MIKPISKHLPAHIIDGIKEFYSKSHVRSSYSNPHAIHVNDSSGNAEAKKEVSSFINKLGIKKNPKKFGPEASIGVKEDVYSKYPTRLFGFTNEIGAAVSPIIGPIGEMLTYIPALTYIFMDTADKYKRGEDFDYKKKSLRQGAERLAFQTFASVILPTGLVKTVQALTDRTIDLKFLKNIKTGITRAVKQKPKLNNFFEMFSDLSLNNMPKGTLTKFALGFQKALNYITVFPLFFKNKGPKSGLRNFALVVVGITALASSIKIIDKFTEKVIIQKWFNKIFHKKATAE